MAEDKDVKKEEEEEQVEEEFEELPEAKAVARYIRVSPYKVREVIDLVRGKDIEEAFDILAFCPKAAAKRVEKVLNSAVSNAEKNLNLKRDDLYVAKAFVDGGPSLKRFRPRAMGRASMIRRRTSHITMVVREKEEE